MAIKLYWYFSIWYFDMPMHFLGGFWVGLALIWLFPLEKIDFKFFIKIILGVLWISILWEVFEVILNNNTTLFPFNTLDTFSDICFDLSGGATALLYFSKRIMLKEVDKV